MCFPVIKNDGYLSHGKDGHPSHGAAISPPMIGCLGNILVDWKFGFSFAKVQEGNPLNTWLCFSKSSILGMITMKVRNLEMSSLTGFTVCISL